MEKKIVKYFLASGFVSSNDASIYQYGLRLLIAKAVHTFVILVIGLVGGEFWGMILFLITYATVREYSGGYHAKSRFGCYACTFVVTVSVLILLKLFGYINFLWLFSVLIICGCIIWIFSPLETKNKPLILLERLTYQRKTRNCLVVFGTIAILGFYNVTFVKGIICAWFIQAVMLLIGMYGKQ